MNNNKRTENMANREKINAYGMNWFRRVSPSNSPDVLLANARPSVPCPNLVFDLRSTCVQDDPTFGPNAGTLDRIFRRPDTTRLARFPFDGCREAHARGPDLT